MLKTSSNRKKKTGTAKPIQRNIGIIAAVCFLFILAIALYFAFMHTRKTAYKIVEAPSIQDIYKYIKPNEFNAKTLVVFDIDNTLLYPKTLIGSEQWFYAMVSKFEAEGMTTQEAINAILPQSFELLEYIPMDPVEPVTVPVINDLQQRGLVTIALTARSLDLTYRTIDLLAQVGIYFQGTGPVQCPIVYGDGKPALYIQGILFCGNHAKGDVLVNWLNQTDYHPKKIIFIDDKQKNLEAVAKALPKGKYQYIGMRHSYLDTHKAKVSPEVMEKELKEFARKYPDARPITDMPQPAQ